MLFIKMSSKLIHSQKPFFSNMVVDAVMCLDQEDLNEGLIGVKKVPGGGMQVSAGGSNGTFSLAF
jgi:T-complex protein 1 subunit eta